MGDSGTVGSSAKHSLGGLLGSGLVQLAGVDEGADASGLDGELGELAASGCIMTERCQAAFRQCDART